MSSREVIKRLKRSGFMRTGGTGDHRKFTHPDGRIVIIPHPVKDLMIGTLRNIFRQAGWNWEGK